MNTVNVPEHPDWRARFADTTQFGGDCIGPGCRLSMLDTDGVQHTGTVQADGVTFEWDDDPNPYTIDGIFTLRPGWWPKDLGR